MTTIDHISKQIKNPTALPIIAFGGGERALIDEALRRVRQQVCGADESGVNYLRMDASEDAGDQLIPSLQTIPFLGERRMIEVHNAEKLTSACVKALRGYIENPNPTSILVLVFEKVDRRNKFISALQEKNVFVSFDLAHERDRIDYVVADAQSSGMQLDRDAAQFLLLLYGGDLLATRAAIQKLALSFENDTVTVDAIQEHVMNHGEQDVFALARSISEGRLADSLLTLSVLRQNKENALKFLGVLMWQFRTLLHIRVCLDRNMSDWEIRKAVGVYRERYDWMQRIAQKKTTHFHSNRLTRLIECDVALKSINLSDPFNFIEKVVYQSASGLTSEHKKTPSQ